MWQALCQIFYIYIYVCVCVCVCVYYLIFSNQKAHEAADIIISFFQQREYGKLKDQVTISGCLIFSLTRFISFSLKRSKIEGLRVYCI